ncbi:variant erythrocyte surface antigen-1 family protein [Babesia caballi]|uniref:Variant erythrocyte surface antigen-1 family protein n=1 Tax=Babesia caballi TaxID=5871 RepID=A0AAV4LX29_BABCB|nr:variant erythrocyte surface antigen-1 family protein [Babesia caballi]
MSGSGQKKSLTEPPQNLKEAIDWVLRVSGRDSNNDGKQAIEGLAGTIQAMLNGDPGDLREEVQEMFGEVRNGVIQKLMSNKPSEPEWGFTVPIAHLNDISGSLITAVKDAPRLVRDVDEISKWLKQDIDSHNGPISDLAGKLKTLLGCNGYNKFDGSGLIQNGNSYKSAYPESLRWPTEPSDQKTCALIFLSCCRLIYYGLTYLYWQCESKDGNWKDQQFQKSGPTNSLSAYLDAMDYSETMFDQGKKNGSHIATVLQSAFPELTKHATNRYPSCSLIRSCRPLFDCPSNPKEAIDWILRVTGKDGQVTGGGDGTNDLTTQVKQLLKDVEGSGTEFGKEIEQVKEALGTSGSDGLIGKLADGLQQFIGYDNNAGSFLSGPENKISGAGIAPSNIPVNRLCDAAVAFTVGVLRSCRGYVKPNDLGKFDGVILAIHNQYGRGAAGMHSIASKVHHDLQSLPGSVMSFLKDVGNEFQKLGSALQTQSQPNHVANKVGEYLKEVFKGSNNKWKGEADNAASKLQALVGNALMRGAYDPTTKNFNTNVENVRNALNTTNASPASVKSILSTGKQAFIWQLQKRNYQPNYVKVEPPINFDVTHAKIFLSCLPLIFNNLSYFYWQCRDGGQWQNQNLTGGSLSPFMEGHWFRNSYMNENMTGTSVVRNVMKTSFQEFDDASSQQKFYSDFLKNFRSKGLATWRVTHQATDQNCLSGLYILCSCYFQCQQIKNSDKASRSPQTIREMLYFLAAFQFSPQYDEFDRYVTEYFKGIISDPTKSTPDARDDSELKLQVADSGTSATGNTLSAADLKSHLLSSCLFAPALLGAIQDHSASKDDPWLHDLYSNSAFPFKYPSSGATLFYALADYTYALQFQLGFLYQQCSQLYVNTCGWFMCTYGQGVNTNDSNGKVVSSHICPVGCTKPEHKNSDKFSEHEKDDCQHSGCGQNANASPLQAFLTDKLTGFSRGHPSSHSGHLGTCSGHTCHVPMGFDKRLRPGRVLQGGHISLTLTPLCGSYTSPLTQLSEKLGCLTKRTPKTLGDIFGFIWTLNSQLFKGGKSADTALSEFFKSIGFNNYLSSSQITPSTFLTYVTHKITGLKSKSSSKAIEKALCLFPGLPFWYNLFMVKPNESLPACLFKVKSTDHKTRYTGNHDDLYSLYNQTCNADPNNTCGQYLYPLCYGNGATYAPTHASTYLSWVLYLSDDLQSWFQDMLEEFKNIDCKVSGCIRCDNSNHKVGQHGTSAACSCDSVVHCGGTLPLLYQHGFRYYNAFQLKNGSKGNGDNKRTCQHFRQQVHKVLAKETPLDNLITSIDAFLYAIRWEFFSKLSGFWTIYISLIVYTFFFLLDTLHMRSHLKLTSHTVPPLALLTSDNPLPTTKLAYIGQ